MRPDTVSDRTGKRGHLAALTPLAAVPSFTNHLIIKLSHSILLGCQIFLHLLLSIFSSNYSFMMMGFTFFFIFPAPSQKWENHVLTMMLVLWIWKRSSYVGM
jgi:hypothetical protein